MGKRLAVIGCGAIGSVIVEGVAGGLVDAEIVALMDVFPDKCMRLAAKRLDAGMPAVTDSLDDLLDASPDIVVEAASQEAVRSYGVEIVARGIDLVVMSVGALLDKGLREKLVKVAHASGASIYVPTGAIAGLDAVRALRPAGIYRVLLRTRKPPRALGYGELGAPETVFRGKASEAVKRFPRNINVVAALYLASGVEPEVEIIADPGVERNIHEITVEAEASRIHIVVENKPSPTNPKTSHLAALSVVELLRKLTGSEILVIGT